MPESPHGRSANCAGLARVNARPRREPQPSARRLRAVNNAPASAGGPRTGRATRRLPSAARAPGWPARSRSSSCGIRDDASIPLPHEAASEVVRMRQAQQRSARSEVLEQLPGWREARARHVEQQGRRRAHLLDSARVLDIARLLDTDPGRGFEALEPHRADQAHLELVAVDLAPLDERRRGRAAPESGLGCRTSSRRTRARNDRLEACAEAGRSASSTPFTITVRFGSSCARPSSRK